MESNWNKSLYRNCQSPDNYTDNSFLENLHKNMKPNTVTVKQAFILGSSISTHLSIIVLYVIVFFWLHNEWTTPNIIFISSTSITIISYVKYSLSIYGGLEKISKDVRIVLAFAVFGYILSPTLKTLTETISTDTIYIMTAIMFLIHLTFSKYSLNPAFFSESLPITSSIFGSLMLTSRLSTPLHAFTLLTVAVQCFVLLPYLLSTIYSKIILSLVIEILTLYFLQNLSLISCFVFFFAVVFIHLVCPILFIKWQKFKQNIYGPWDEAIVKSSR